jgi:hypothetical protein
MVVRRFDVFLIALNPTKGREIRKTRPCLIISPDEMNKYIACSIRTSAFVLSTSSLAGLRPDQLFQQPLIGKQLVVLPLGGGIGPRLRLDRMVLEVDDAVAV